MADFLNTATAPIPPAAQAIEEHHYADLRSKPKAKPPARRVVAPVAEPLMDEPEEGEMKHSLDLDA